MIFDVAIAGAGPVGLFLADELALAGIRVLVLEKSPSPVAPLKRMPFGLRGLTAPTVEAFDRRGLLDQIASPQARDAIIAGAHWTQGPRRPAGHFAGIPFFDDRIDDGAWPYRLPGPATTSLAVEMQTLETVLAARAQSLGVDIRRGLGVEGIDRLDEAVAIHAGRETFHARWLVGCDGGRSNVRKAAGFDFVGTDAEFTGYSAQVELADSDSLPIGRHYTPAGMYTHAHPGTIAMVDFDGGAMHRAGPISREHVEAVLRRISGVEVRVTALHLAATWTDRARQASAYRQGRVLLAGDAAHIHSPLGGQGLNLGLGDAMNLGWKLAAVVKGQTLESLLDTYEAERHPVAAQVLDWSRAQVALMRPNPGSRALGAILRDLIDTRDGATYFAGRVRGLSLRYDLGDPHPLVGRSAPDFTFADGGRLSERLRSGKGVLLDFGDTPSLGEVRAPLAGQVDYITGAPQDALGQSALLVRPDGVVAWVAEGAPDPELAAKAAARWFAA